MTISTRTIGTVDVLTVTGRVDRSSDLGSAVKSSIARGFSRVAVDLSGVDFMDSSGLGELAAGLQACMAAGGGLVLVNPSARVADVLRLAGVATRYQRYASTSEAVAALTR